MTRILIGITYASNNLCRSAQEALSISFINVKTLIHALIHTNHRPLNICTGMKRENQFHALAVDPCSMLLFDLFLFFPQRFLSFLSNNWFL